MWAVWKPDPTYGYIVHNSFGATGELKWIYTIWLQDG